MVNNVSLNGKIRVQWSDRPENYSRDAKNKIRNYFSKKYGVSKESIDVIYTAVKFNDKGDKIIIDGATIDNILDKEYQRSLMKEWLLRENITVNIERLFKLDDKVNAELNVSDDYNSSSRWSLKWITLNNFLSYGSDNMFHVSKLKGLNIVNSTPNENQSGKCVRGNTKIKIRFNPEEIIEKLGFLPEELK